MPQSACRLSFARLHQAFKKSVRLRDSARAVRACRPYRRGICTQGAKGAPMLGFIRDCWVEIVAICLLALAASCVAQVHSLV